MIGDLQTGSQDLPHQKALPNQKALHVRRRLRPNHLLDQEVVTIDRRPDLRYDISFILRDHGEPRYMLSCRHFSASFLILSRSTSCSLLPEDNIQV